MNEKRVLHVVTLMSDRNIYGGPVGVATDFQDSPPAGFEFTIFTTFLKGDLNLETLNPNVLAFQAHRLLPVSSFSVLFSLRMIYEFYKTRKKWTLVHIHLARDLVTLPIGILCSILRIPFVIQAHGMLESRKKGLSFFVDRCVTNFVVKNASAILFLTPLEESKYIRDFKVDVNKLFFLPNAAPKINLSVKRLETFQVCFVARLHPRKRPLDFVLAAAETMDEEIKFLMVGHNQGEEHNVVKEIARLQLKNIEVSGPVTRENALKVMAYSRIVVLPSSNEPYPLSIIESLSLGTPVIVTNECGIAHLILKGGGGLVVQVGNVVELASAIAKIKMDWFRFHLEALDLSKNFSRKHVNDKLSAIYRSAYIGE